MPRAPHFRPFADLENLLLKTLSESVVQVEARSIQRFAFLAERGSVSMARILSEFNIVIEGRSLSGASKTLYEASVIQWLMVLRTFATGRALLHWIKNAGGARGVLIAPYGTSFYSKYGSCNALATEGWHAPLDGTVVPFLALAKVNFSQRHGLGPVAPAQGRHPTKLFYTNSSTRNEISVAFPDE